jgi:hypothetical protein
MEIAASVSVGLSPRKVLISSIYASFVDILNLLNDPCLVMATGFECRRFEHLQIGLAVLRLVDLVNQLSFFFVVYHRLS